ncbi:MAG: hypothetical protein AAGK30_07770 [Pseudomonadota bacterium]
MRRVLFALSISVCCGSALAEDDPIATAIEQCLSCHLQEDGQIDIVGVRALSGLPVEWPFLFEDAYDLDGDGIAGRIRFVSGDSGPMIAKYGKSLAAARFADFARIAGAAHGVDLSAPGVLDALETAFEVRSPEPHWPFPDPGTQARFEARGCAGCHVTETFELDGRTYMPLSDFLLHDLGQGLRRTAPLWGCRDCLDAADPHPTPPGK